MNFKVMHLSNINKTENMSKIHFIIALATLCSLMNLHSSNKAPAKEIYIQLYSVRDDIKQDFKGTIAKIAGMGFTGIEAAGYSDGKFYGLLPADFKKEVESRGLKMLSSHVGKSLHDDVAKTNWDEIWKWWDTAIQAHKAAGLKYIVVPSMPKVKNLATLKAYCDYFNSIGEKCNAAGIGFGYHNHSFEFEQVEGQMMYDYMLKNTDPTKVFFQMDVYWVVRGGQSPVEYFSTYPGRFKMLHLKDNKELGQSGMVGFDAIFQNTAKAGVRYMVLEVEHYNFTPLESVRKSIGYLLAHPGMKATYKNGK